MTNHQVTLQLQGSGLHPVDKVPTGIQGLDDITDGGLPKGRPTLVCGDAGSGKTLMAMEFLVRGATQYGEPGLFMSFEETAEELAQNVASLGFDVNDLMARGKLIVDHVHIDSSEFQEAGDYDLEGLFVRLGYQMDEIGAKRVVLDTIEALFAGLHNPIILRSELRRLFAWLKQRGVTAVITGERGTTTLTRQGLEEYISDCVITLDHRVADLVATRRLRIVKYRGSRHGTNEYPFLVGDHGISIQPVTSLALQHIASDERIPSGVPRLDAMLGGHGYYRGSSILVSGTSGTGKTSLAANLADAACRRGERVLYFALEESADQIMRNMRSIGLDLKPWVQQGLLWFSAARPTAYGLEVHLATMQKAIETFRPGVAIFDPVTAFEPVGTDNEIKSMLMRLVDSIKASQITGLFTSLTSGGRAIEQSEVGVSSVMDTWLLLQEIETGGERNRGLYILKSRGMAHSNQIREFRLTDHGVELLDVYVGPAGVLTGSARLAQEAQDSAELLELQHEVERQQMVLEGKRQMLEAQIAALRAEMVSDEAETQRVISTLQQRKAQMGENREKMARSRQADQ
ncbi:MAG TPA: circadian clock protein KaiC [Anaerolineae bacterium]|nr:circadian clock protein KaiC [Anaerolineae bacterium]